MSQVMYSLWCEWDCGFDGKLFPSEGAALDYAASVLPACGINDTVQDLLDAGLLGTTEHTIVTRKR